jgi:Na+/melibiose symporter-like transporter
MVLMSENAQPLSSFPDGTIDLGISEQNLRHSGIISPIKSRVIKLGSSSGVIIPIQVLKHLGFKIGEYVNVILQPREPSEDELTKERKKQKRKKV